MLQWLFASLDFPPKLVPLHGGTHKFHVLPAIYGFGDCLRTGGNGSNRAFGINNLVAAEMPFQYKPGYFNGLDSGETKECDIIYNTHSGWSFKSATLEGMPSPSSLLANSESSIWSRS